MKVRIQVPRGEVIRYLGYPTGAVPRPDIEAAVDELWPAAMALIEPRGVHCVIDGRQAEGANMPEPTSTVGIAVCTVGDELLQEADERAARGAYLESLILDAFGSAAAEATADIFSKVICNEATRLGLFAQRRISPGYGTWSTSSQEALLALLPAESVGITLTRGQMMRPRKSVSFAQRFLEEPDENTSKGCAHCTMKNCEYRQEEPL